MEYDYKKLTEKQKRFIDYYIETGNATKASELAGYKGKNLNNIGSENLAKLGRYIEKKLEQKQEERIASQDEVLEYLTKVMRGELEDYNNTKPSITERTKCAELLGKRYGTFKEKVDVSGNIPVVIEDDITE